MLQPAALHLVVARYGNRLLTAPYTRTTAADQSCIRVHTGTLPAAAPHTANRSGLERYRQRRCAHRSSPVTATDSVTRNVTSQPQPNQRCSCANAASHLA